MQNGIAFSVALVTRNRPESLARTLASLRAQSVQPSEVVVSDDSDKGADEIRNLCAQFDARYIEGPRRGLYANRNRAAAACHGTHVRTMDDDHEFPAGHFAACMQAVHRDPEAVWFIGEVVPDEQLPGDSPLCPGQLHPRGFSIAPEDNQKCWAISDGASIYPRALFERGIRFSEAFKFGAMYLEFGSLLHSLGYRMRFLDRTYIIHHLDLANRSFADSDMELSARLFAGLCHSFIYQPTFRNKTLCTLEIIRRTAFSGQRGLAVRQAALAAFTARRHEVDPLLQGARTSA